MADLPLTGGILNLRPVRVGTKLWFRIRLRRRGETAPLTQWDDYTPGFRVRGGVLLMTIGIALISGLLGILAYSETK